MTLDIIDNYQLAPPWDIDDTDFATASEVSDRPFREALRDVLLAAPGAGDLLDAYYQQPPPGAAFPFLVFSLLWQRTVIITTSRYYREASYQVTVYAIDTDEASGSEQADAIAQALYDALLPVADAEPIVFSGGYEMTRYPGPGTYHGPDAQDSVGVRGRTVWMAHFDYSWLIGLT